MDDELEQNYLQRIAEMAASNARQVARLQVQASQNKSTMQQLLTERDQAVAERDALAAQLSERGEPGGLPGDE